MVWQRSLNLVIVLAFVLLLLCGPALASDANLIAHWTFDEGSGTVAYDSAGDNDGILVGNPIRTGGQIDGALSFDGTDDYVDLSSTVQFDNKDFTITGWFRTASDTTGTYEQIWMSGYETIGEEDLELAVNDGNLVFVARDQSGDRTRGVEAENINDDNWHHFVALRHGNDFVLYLDSVLTASDTESLGDVDATGVIPRIGNGIYTATNRFFDGLIDDVRIYNAALSAEEIELLYWTGIGGVGLAICDIEQALVEKASVMVSIDAALEKEWQAYDVLEQMLISGDYEGLSKRDIAAAQRKVEAAIMRQERSKEVVLESIVQLEDALLSLGAEP